VLNSSEIINKTHIEICSVEDSEKKKVKGSVQPKPSFLAYFRGIRLKSVDDNDIQN
jgi:hypothetical protein